RVRPFIPPLQHPQRAERVPAAGRTEAFQFEVCLALPAVLQRPAAVAPPGVLNDLDRLGEALVARRTHGLEMVQGTEDVVVPPWREGETREYRLDDFTGAVGAKEPMHQQELTPAALRGPHRLPLAAALEFVEP